MARASYIDTLAEALLDRQREVLQFRYGRDLTDADSASIVGLSAMMDRARVR